MNQKMTSHFETISTEKQSIDWILEKQAGLRVELLAFFKKDIKEIDSAVSSIDMGDEKNDFRKQVLSSVQSTFLVQWQRSYDLVCPSHLMAQPQLEESEE